MTSFREGTEVGLKTCNECGKILPITNFYKQKGGGQGVRGRCKQCVAKYDNHPDIAAKRKKFRTDNPYYGKDYYLQRNYGVDLSWFENKLNEQNNKCGLCSKSRTPQARFAVDHDHATGKLRDVLCGRCNLFLGHIEANPDLAGLALAYLARHSHGL